MEDQSIRTNIVLLLLHFCQSPRYLLGSQQKINLYGVHLESESDPSAKASSGEVGSLLTGSALYV